MVGKRDEVQIRPARGRAWWRAALWTACALLQGGLVRLAALLLTAAPGGIVCGLQASDAQAASLPSAGRLRAGTIVQLTSDGGHYVQPSWSPDGQWIAFARAGFGSIEVMRPDGTARRLLVNAPRAGYRFAWSPDSQEIAFLTVSQQDQTRRYQIRLVEIQSGRVRTVADATEELSPPQWEVGESGRRPVWAVFPDAAPSNWRRQAGAFESLRRSGPKPPLADGTLVFYRDGQVWLWPVGKDRPQRLSRERGLNPVRSPDGAGIVFSELNTLMVVNADGTELRELTRGHHPAWSPDGSKLVFTVARDDGHRIISSDLWVINTDGTEHAPLTYTDDAMESEPDWSPDGRRIVYRLENNGQICVLQLEW